jgi:hypothetical protein
MPGLWGSGKTHDVFDSFVCPNAAATRKNAENLFNHAIPRIPLCQSFAQIGLKIKTYLPFP